MTKQRLIYSTRFHDNYDSYDEYRNQADQPDLTDDEVYRAFSDETWAYDDLMSELEDVVSKYDCILIGTVGLWHGTRTGYRYAKTFSELHSAICGYADIKFQYEGRRLMVYLYHHDGTHCMELRVVKEYVPNYLQDVFGYGETLSIDEHHKVINYYTKCVKIA